MNRSLIEENGKKWINRALITIIIYSALAEPVLQDSDFSCGIKFRILAFWLLSRYFWSEGFLQAKAILVALQRRL